MSRNMTDSAPKDDSPRTAEPGRPVALSVRELESAEGRARWADTLDRTYCEMDVDWSRSSDRFAADLIARPIGDLIVSVVRADPHTVMRTPAMIDSDPNDDFLLCLITQGSAILTQGPRTAILENGAFGIVDSSTPFVVDGTTEFTSRLPLDVVESVTGHGISGQSGIGRLVSRFLVDVAATETPLSGGTSDSVAAAALDLLVTAISDRATPLSATMRTHADDLRKVQATMIRYLHDPDHTLAEIGTELGMSLRYIHKLFSAAGTTPRTWLYEVRLGRARTMLLETDLTVTAISVHVGFRDVSHFSRAFRRRFGSSPAHFRLDPVVRG